MRIRTRIRVCEELVADMNRSRSALSLVEDDVHLTEPDHESLGLEETGFVVFDLETTGAKAPPGRVLEIGAYLVKNGGIAAEFHSLVNPEMPIPPFIAALTGISDEMVSVAPVVSRFCPAVPRVPWRFGSGASQLGFTVIFLNY